MGAGKSSLLFPSLTSLHPASPWGLLHRFTALPPPQTLSVSHALLLQPLPLDFAGCRAVTSTFSHPLLHYTRCLTGHSETTTSLAVLYGGIMQMDQLIPPVNTHAPHSSPPFHSLCTLPTPTSGTLHNLLKPSRLLRSNCVHLIGGCSSNHT